MELSDIEYNKAKHFLLKRNIQPEEIESFYFMKHHYRTGQYSPGTKIGASILTLQLKKGIKVLRLKKDQTAILKFLISKESQFQLPLLQAAFSCFRINRRQLPLSKVYLTRG